MAVSSYHGEIAREGLIHLDDMYLVRFEPVSKSSWQPEIFVLDPTV